VLQLGAPHASKVLAQWLAASGAERVAVDRAGTWWDPERQLALLLEATIGPFAAALAGEVWRSADEVPRPAGWAGRWRAADDAAAAALAGLLGRTVATGGPDDGPALVTEPEVAALLAARVGAGEALVVSSSMPVRDVEWYAPRRAGLRVLANRGANGIDGVVSTAVGAALTSRPLPAWLLIGDLALLHDRNGLLGAARRSLRLRLVVVDNDGGGIFSFLPQAAAVGTETFERFFGTPHGVDLAALLAVEGIEARSVCDRPGLDVGLAWLADTDAPVAALVVRTNRAANVAAHDVLHQRMVEGVEASLAT
jgi:2-succinyl-5-enolpyruvyl-6-hydroxy-3-cyclohexene-1-carboxylate synthase